MAEDRIEPVRGTEELEAATLNLPRWIENGATLKLIAFLLVLFAAPAILPWRDTLTIPVTIASQSPPRSALAPSDGVIAAIYVRPGSEVAAGTPLAQLGDVRTIEQAATLGAFAGQVIALTERDAPLPPPPPIAIGHNLQAYYDALATAVIELRAVEDFGSAKERLIQLERAIPVLEARQQKAKDSRDLAESLVALSSQRLEAKTEGAARGWVSGDALTQAREALIERKLAVQRIDEEIEQLGGQLEQARSDLAQARLEGRLDSSRMDTQVRQKAINLLGALKSWREQTTITAPIGGRVKFPSPPIVGQSLSAGNEFAVLVPRDSTIAATGMVAPNSRADVPVGAEVRIALPNYPTVRYGYVPGIVDEVADVASADGYSLRIRLPQGLRTVNGVALPVRQRANAMGYVSVRQGRLFDAVMGRLLAGLGFN